MQTRFAVKGEQLGYAAMTKAGHASIFSDPEQQKARVSSLTNGTFLGHVVAREIGHLLLGANSHAGGHHASGVASGG